jgi:two-component system, NarL family, nitrate/nitrite response regulator NarL
MPARILVVDDVPAVRKGLCSLLSSYELEICGEAENGKQAVDQVQELYPDIVVLDISMPVMDGLRATIEIRRVAPSTKIVLFSIHDGPQAKTAARMVGADALVSKAAAAFDLVPTLRRLFASQAFVN